MILWFYEVMEKKDEEWNHLMKGITRLFLNLSVFGKKTMSLCQENVSGLSGVASRLPWKAAPDGSWKLRAIGGHLRVAVREPEWANRCLHWKIEVFPLCCAQRSDLHGRESKAMTPYLEVLIKDALEKVLPEQLSIPVLQRQTPPDLIQIQAWCKYAVIQNVSISSARPSSCSQLLKTFTCAWQCAPLGTSVESQRVQMSGRHYKEIHFPKTWPILDILLQIF